MLSVEERRRRHTEYMRGWRLRGGVRYQERHRTAVKIEVLVHYGNGRCSCVMCGESRLACLSIDHINGNGSKERKALKRYGYSFYLFLRRENYPKGLQTLCMNCQFCKVVLDKSRKEEVE